MSLLGDIEKIRENTFMTGVFGVLMLFAPGMLTIFLLQRDLFMSLDFFKLLFLSVAYIVPYYTVMLFAVMVGIDQDGDLKDSLWYVSSMMSLLITGVLFYLMLAIALIRDVTFQSAMTGLTCASLVVAVLIAVAMLLQVKKK